MRSRAVHGTLALALLLASAAPARANEQRAVSDSRSPAEVAFVNVFYVPGKALTCAGGSIMATLALLLTFGNAHEDAGEVLRGACGGPWSVEPSRGQFADDQGTSRAR